MSKHAEMLHFRHLFLILVLCLLAGCAATERQKAAAPTLSGEQRMRFREYYTAGILARETEDMTGALVSFERALRLAPDDPNALFQMSQVLQYAADDSTTTRRAHTMLRRAHSLMPANAEYKETLALQLLEMDSTEAAIPLYEELADLTKNNEHYLASLVSLYFNTQRYDKVLETLDRLEQKATDPEMIAGGRLMALIGKGDTLGAMKVIADYVEHEPDTLSAKVWAGLRYLELGRKQEALAEWEAVEKADPDHPKLQVAQFMYYGEQNDTASYHRIVRRGILNPRQDARQRSIFLRVCMLSLLLDNNTADGTGGSERAWAQSVLEEAYKRPDADADIVSSYAMALEENGADFDALEPVWLTLLRLSPTDNQARMKLLLGYRDRDDMEAYYRICHEGQEAQPHELIFYYVEGVEHYEHDETAKALEILQKGTRLAADSITYRELTSDVYTLTGDILHSLKRNDEAYAAYDSALAYNPENLLCMNNYAYFLSLEGKKLELAEQLSRATVDAEPQNTTYLDTYAWVLYVGGKIQQAAIYIDQAIRFMPDDELDATVYDHAGDINAALDKADEARSHWKKALDLSDDAELNRELRKKLKR